jgi:two-component system response regulator RegA
MELEIAMTTATAAALPNERSLLIVEDDKSFLQRLARAMEGRGFVVTTAESVADGLLQVEKAAPAFAVVDMRLGDGNGLDVISAMKKRRPEARAIILTGYGNIATTSSASTNCAAATSRKPRAASTCIAVPCSASSPNARPNSVVRLLDIPLTGR